MYERYPIEIATAVTCTMNPELAWAIMARVGAVAAYAIPSGSHYGVTDATGATVIYVPLDGRTITVTPRSQDMCTDLPGAPTRDALEPGGWDVDMTGNASTTSVRTGSPLRTRRPATDDGLRYGPVCTTCWVTTPLSTGICEECNDD